MDVRQRLRRLEQGCTSTPDGLRPCKACANGTQNVLRMWFEGNPEPEPALCESCGRDLTYRINYYNAVPHPRPAETPETPA